MRRFCKSKVSFPYSLFFVDFQTKEWHILLNSSKTVAVKFLHKLDPVRNNFQEISQETNEAILTFLPSINFQAVFVTQHAYWVMPIYEVLHEN